MKNKYFTTIIKKIEKENFKVRNFILDTSISAKPGQYVMIWIPGENEKPFGVVTTTPLTLSIAKIGPFTEKLHKLKPGDKITYRGPYGTFFKIKGNKPLLVGGGYGVVPLYFLAANLSKSLRSKTTVIIGAKTSKELTFVNKFRKLGVKVLVTTDDGSSGFKGFTTQLIEKLLLKNKFSSFYTCGPEIMMKKIAQLAKLHKIYCELSLERFFKCGGMGICGECYFKGQLVCKDGPVFPGSILLDN